MSEDWKVYENLEDFKEYFCDWIDSIVDEGYTDDSKILAMRRDGSIFFNFRDIVLRHPDNDSIQDLFIEIKNIGTARMKDLFKFELSVLIEKNRQQNEKKLNTEIEKLFSKNHPPERNQTNSVKKVQVITDMKRNYKTLQIISKLLIFATKNLTNKLHSCRMTSIVNKKTFLVIFMEVICEVRNPFRKLKSKV